MGRIIHITESQFKRFISEEIDSNNNAPKFKPTIEWMRTNYDKANKELFNSRLGYCNFEVKNIGTNMLGEFRLFGDGYHKILVNRFNRTIFARDTITGDESSLTIRENFEKYGNPTIVMSSIYSGTESALYSTLVHEMCHYYTYCYGYAPLQGHGREFREIAQLVSIRSNGKISIQRLADAEEMNDRELDADIQQKIEKRNKNKMNRANYFCLFKLDSNTNKPTVFNLTNATSDSLISQVESYAEKYNYNLIHITSFKLISKLFNEGYDSQMRTLRVWDLLGKPILIEDIMANSDNYEYIVKPSNNNSNMNEDIELESGNINNNDNEFIEIKPNMNLGVISLI